jgi:uncharacterized lipoprotein YmbA
MMPLPSSKLLIVLIFVLAGYLLSGCISSNAPATRFYVLNPVDSRETLDTGRKDALSLEIGSLHLPQYLERPQIVTRNTGNRLDLAEFHQWGGNLRKNMMRVLAKDFSLLLGTAKVYISPHHPQTPVDFRVQLQVMKFERDPDGKVRLSTQWLLSRGRDRKPLGTSFTDLESPAVPKHADVEETVSAMSALLGELSLIISREIVKQLEGRD